MADYTPSANFELTTTGYTPSADFSFASSITYDLAFGQAWQLAAYAVADSAFSQQWELAGTTIAEAQVSQQWSLEIFTYLDFSARQQWELLTPTFANTFSSHRWAFAAPAFATSTVDHRWAISVPTFADTMPSQSWGLTAFDYADIAAGLSWQLVAIDGAGDLAWRQKWALQATAIWTRVISSVTYTLTLTGYADATTDLILPMSNYRSELRSDQSSYLQVTVPHGRRYAGQIAARSNGELVISRGIRWSDGEIEVDEIARATLETIIPYVGGRSSSVALQARREPVTITPQTLALSGASYWTRSGNKLRYRCPIDNRLRPGDTVQIDGNEFVVGTVQHTVGTQGGQMEIVEA
jgi:hypothetical protein